MGPEQPRVAPRHLAVVGAGWAGLAAAIRGCALGMKVTVFEMAPQAGGRARSMDAPDEAQAQPKLRLDNGQHILIGAYTRTLDLMRTVGVDPDLTLQRQPLMLVDEQGRGLRLPKGHAVLAFVLGVLRCQTWPLQARWALLGVAIRWRLQNFQCSPRTTVAQLTASLPRVIRDDLIDPLCVAALNTPASQASGSVFLRVLRDALFAGPGAADLLLPREPLAHLLPEPAWAWLESQGATIKTRHRVMTIQRSEGAWRVDGEPFDGVVLACSAPEAARLTGTVSPAWAQQASAVAYQAIVTVYAHHPMAQLPSPMVALRATEQNPAQFAFDLGRLRQAPGCLALVVSGANSLLLSGLPEATRRILHQAAEVFASQPWGGSLQAISTIAERRATFACTPGLVRPPMAIAPHCVAAGDYVEGPYPATLEGAIRSGEAAVQACWQGMHAKSKVP